MTDLGWGTVITALLSSTASNARTIFKEHETQAHRAVPSLDFFAIVIRLAQTRHPGAYQGRARERPLRRTSGNDRRGDQKTTMRFGAPQKKDDDCAVSFESHSSV